MDDLGNWPIPCRGGMPAGNSNCRGDGTSPGKMHSCPEKEFWHSDSRYDLCNCCQACTNQCAEDS